MSQGHCKAMLHVQPQQHWKERKERGKKQVHLHQK